MRCFKIVTLLLGLSIFHGALSAPITAIVDGGTSYGHHLYCKAYLHLPNEIHADNNNLITLHFIQNGAGIYTTYFDPPWTTTTNYYLTIEKPGITPNPTNPDEPIVNRQQFDYYTMETLINCDQNALYWADHYLGNIDKTIVIGGHSEGTIVMTNMVHRILLDNTQIGVVRANPQ